MVITASRMLSELKKKAGMGDSKDNAALHKQVKAV